MANGAFGTTPHTRTGLAPGTVLNNNYRIVRPLGEGGMGAVYLACNTFIDEDQVAIKVIRSEQARDEMIQAMFAKEVRALLRISNPRIVGYRTYAHDPELGIDFIVTEYIDGDSLASVMGRRKFGTADLLTLITESCIGLRAAHLAGVVHRDLAPDNILLEGGDISRPKIIDFGIVKDTLGGGTIVGAGFAGKPNFVAPEQLGEPDYPVGPWTDIYSLALVVLGLANGKVIEMGHTPGAAIRKRHEPIDLSPLAPELRPLIADMLALHPEQRLRSAEEVMIRAEQVRVQGPGETMLLPKLDKTIIAPTATIQTLYQPGQASGKLVGDRSGGPEQKARVGEELEDEEYLDNDEEAPPDSGNLAMLLLIGIVVLVGMAMIGGMLVGEVISVPENQAAVSR